MGAEKIFINENLTWKGVALFKFSPSGRYVLLKITMEGSNYFLVNIYVPTDYREQEIFVEMLSENLISKTDTSSVIAVGDWNTIFNKLDNHGKVPWKETTYRNSVCDLMEEIGLVDIHRLLHPKTKQLTYESKALCLKSRIDFLLISDSLYSETKRCEIRPAIALDHKTIFLEIKLKSEMTLGPASWKFNNSLLSDENYINLITFIYPQILAKYKDIDNKQLLLWELMKMEIRGRTIKYSKNKRCELKKRVITLQEMLQALDHKVCNSENFDQETLDKFTGCQGRTTKHL